MKTITMSVEIPVCTHSLHGQIDSNDVVPTFNTVVLVGTFHFQR